jgi:hypothetical protein
MRQRIIDGLSSECKPDHRCSPIPHAARLRGREGKKSRMVTSSSFRDGQLDVLAHTFDALPLRDEESPLANHDESH